MNFENFPRRLSPLEQAALFSAVKARAIELRREAIEQFWSAVARGIASAWRAARRRLQWPLATGRSGA